MTNLVRLQYIGLCPGVLVSEIKVGDTLMWNYGITSEVVAIEAKSRHFVVITERSKDGTESKRTMKLSRYVVRTPWERRGAK